MDKESVHKEIDLIQSVIVRMASNSFEVKKWLIGIITAIVVLRQEQLLRNNYELIWILLLPVLSFWYLDAFFLSREKLFKEIYRWVIVNRSKTDDYLYDLNTTKRICNGEITDLNKKKNGIIHTAFSATLLSFYLIPILCILMITFSQFFLHRR